MLFSSGQDLSGVHWCVNRRSESMVCSERLRLKAALFCVFIYLDTRSLLTAAEVCVCVCVKNMMLCVLVCALLVIVKSVCVSGV